MSVLKEVVIVGEFNLPSLDWNSDNVLHSCVAPCEMLFFSDFSLLRLREWVKENAFVDSGNALHLVESTFVDSGKVSNWLVTFLCLHISLDVTSLPSCP